MAISFATSRPFLTSTIIGATRMDQLKTDIAAEAISLPQELLEAIDVLHARFTYPCP